MSQKKYLYNIFPPYIDAYIRNDDRFGRTLKEIKGLMIGHASEWCEQSIGRSILKTGNPLMIGDKYIVCCANLRELGNKDKRRTFIVVLKNIVAIENDSMNYECEVIESDYAYEWDVT